MRCNHWIILLATWLILDLLLRDWLRAVIFQWLTKE
jgi:hypothetical protein